MASLGILIIIYIFLVTRPTVSLLLETSSNDGVVYIGSTAVVHCIAVVSGYVDTPFEVEFKWYRHGNLTASGITNSTMVSLLEYQSLFTIAPVNETMYEIVCEARVISLKNFYVLSSWYESEQILLQPTGNVEHYIVTSSYCLYRA